MLSLAQLNHQILSGWMVIRLVFIDLQKFLYFP